MLPRGTDENACALNGVAASSTRHFDFRFWGHSRHSSTGCGLGPVANDPTETLAAKFAVMHNAALLQ